MSKLDDSYVDVSANYTEIEQIPSNIELLRLAFSSGKTHSIQFRLNQLRNLYFAIKDNELRLIDAINSDFNRSKSETKILEVHQTLANILFTMSNLVKWSKPEPVSDLPISLRSNPVYTERIPIGIVLVMGAFNYPLVVNLNPLIGALAAGNCIVLKPSEQTPKSSELLISIISQALDDDIFYAVHGGISETTALLNEKFDKIVFTGSTTIGKIIAKKAAETLTPVILELGGKSPAFVLEDVKDSDLATIASRIVWARFTNAGQTCIAVDYVLVHKLKRLKLVEELIKAVNKFYPNLTESDPNYTHLINHRGLERLNGVIKSTNGNIVTTGKPSGRFLPPTIIDNVDWKDSSMEQELFGPILPIIEYDNLSTTISKVIHYHDTPLALYIFTSGSTSRLGNNEVNEIRTRIRSGGTIVNDALLHAGLKNAPFGGVGSSGYGNYGGEFSFKSFTHQRTTIEQKLLNEKQLKPRYPPFTANKSRIIEVAQTDYNGKVWFGRNGNVRINGPSRFFTVIHTTAGICALVYALSASL